MSKILVADAIAQEGLELLNSRAQVDVKIGLKPEELLEILPEYDALVVRSETKVTAEAIRSGKRLQVIARAGIGVDNIDLEAATSAGIAVVNAPTGNTVAAAEHTMALMLALARNIPDAHHSVKGGQWRRSAFMGIEVRNKTLGIAGLGRVGTEVARRALSFGMRLLGYDPFVSPDYALRLGVELLSLEDLLAQSETRVLVGDIDPDLRVEDVRGGIRGDKTPPCIGGLERRFFELEQVRRGVRDRHECRADERPGNQNPNSQIFLDEPVKT